MHCTLELAPTPLIRAHHSCPVLLPAPAKPGLPTDNTTGTASGKAALALSRPATASPAPSHRPHPAPTQVRGEPGAGVAV